MSCISLMGTPGLATPREGSWDLGWHHPAPSLLCYGDAGGRDGDPHEMKEANPKTTEGIPHASASGTPGEPARAACPIPTRRQRSPEQRLLFQPGWRRQFLSLPKFQAFYSPPLLFFFPLVLKTKVQCSRRAEQPESLW